MTRLAKALRYLTDYIDGEAPEGAAKCAEILESMVGDKKPKQTEDGYLHSVLAAAWDTGPNGPTPRPKLFVNASGGDAIVKLTPRNGSEVETRVGLRGGVLTTESLREAAAIGIRTLVDKLKRGQGGDR